MIRERNQVSLAYIAGGTVRSELSKDACYHQIQLSTVGSVSSVNTGSSTAANHFSQNFPFNLMKNIILRRNGSDIVFQSSGDLLAKEDLYLNGNSPHARLTDASNNLLTAVTVQGLAIPSNSAGIGQASAEFADAGTSSSTIVTNFEFQLEIWLQLGVEDRFVSTLVDARPLSSFVLEIQWANPLDVIIPAAQSALTISATTSVYSYDQDNVAAQLPFGTFKRSVQAIANAQYSSANQQFLLTRGNFYYGIVFQTQSFKSGSTVIPRQEQAVITTITNRVNTNYYLRVSDFEVLQRKNKMDEITEGMSYGTDSGHPRGFAHLYYPVTGDRLSELVPSFSMDTWDLLLALGAGTENGSPTGGTLPVINMLIEEVIPGKSIAPNMPPAAFAGSTRQTSASPYRG